MGKESRVLELGHNRQAWRKAQEMLSFLSVGKHLRPFVLQLRYLAQRVKLL